MPSRLAQAGILAPQLPFGRSLRFQMTSGGQALPLLRTLDPSFGVLGIGPAMALKIPGLRPFPDLPKVPSTQSALWLMVRGEDRSQVFDRAEAAGEYLAPSFVVEDAVDTFIYRGGRDLTGYVDGTENPKGDDAVEVALCTDGSSFVAVQRWTHDLAAFNRQSIEVRDNVIGRRRETDEELEEAPESAHAKRTAQEDFDPPAFMLRRSMPFTTANSLGLEFIAYGRTLDFFERSLKRMIGLDDGIVDGLFSFSTPVTGGYYWCPPLKDGRFNLDLLAT